MNSNEPAATEPASRLRDNPCYGSDATVAMLNVLADDGKSYHLPYAQLLYAEMIPNPVLESKPDAPPEKLVIHFAVAEVTMLGCGFQALERNLQKCELKFVKSAGRRFAVPPMSYVASVTIAFTKDALHES